MQTILYVFSPLDPERGPPPVNASEDNLRYWMDTRTERLLTSTVEVREEVEGVDDAESVTYELRSFLRYRLSDCDKSKTLTLGRAREGRVSLIASLFSLLISF